MRKTSLLLLAAASSLAVANNEVDTNVGVNTDIVNQQILINQVTQIQPVQQTAQPYRRSVEGSVLYMNQGNDLGIPEPKIDGSPLIIKISPQLVESDEQ